MPGAQSGKRIVSELRSKHTIGGGTSDVNTPVFSLPDLPLRPTARRYLACRIIRTVHS